MNKQSAVCKTNGNQPLTRKPSIRNKKPPEVKQTLTSKFRLLKANPLLLLELHKSKDQDSTNLSTLFNKPLKTVVDSLDEKLLNRKVFAVESHPKNNLELLPTSSTIKSEARGPKSKTNLSSTSFKVSCNDVLSSTRRETRKELPGNKNNVALKSLKTTGAIPKSNAKITVTADKSTQPSVSVKTTVRRSLSAQHIERKKSSSSCYIDPKKSASMEDVFKRNLPHNPTISPIIEETSFKTPHSNYKRQSVVFGTPQSINHRKSLFLATPSSQELKKRLDEWLQRRGKSIDGYHHLKCFGVTQRVKREQMSETDEENKENIKLHIRESNSYDDLQIIQPGQKVEENAAKSFNLPLAKEALFDLHKLILEGYSNTQCEAWLKLIHNSYKGVEEESQYWECRAALEQARGNITSAVECYKNAIVQGAEVNAVDESLDQLLQKFSLLNIDTEKDKNSEDRARVVQDARNIFKSSIIQFAVQERTMKKNSKEGVKTEKKLVATPVRRSTRLSRSAFTSTPGVTMYSSLNEMDRSIRDTLTFRSNRALIDE